LPILARLGGDSFGRDDGDEAALLALVLELDDACDLGERVSSEPRPTLRPGLWGVPRWRTRMLPPVTVSAVAALDAKSLGI
jgi:hypothetical protein